MVFQVAIDGPVGSGKSTVARLVAARSGFLFIDTGAMYRAVALYLLKNVGHVAVRSEEAFNAVLKHINDNNHIIIDFKTTIGEQKVFLNGEDVTREIRSPKATSGSSDMAAYPEVRKLVTDRARELAEGSRVVMEGRDIGTKVLPDAQLKVYLDAAVEVRAKRRHQELIEKGASVGYEKILEDVKQRDYNDMNRDADPLKKAEDAVGIDVGSMETEDVVDIIINLMKERGGL